MATLVFWIDVDNTLLANDDVKKDLDEHLKVWVGPVLAEKYWDIYEQVRHERRVVDIPLALDRFRQQVPLSQMDEQTYIHVHSIFDNYPFEQRLYPYALETLQHLNTLGVVVIVSDGDLCYQQEKIFNSALAITVQGRVLIFDHKQEHLDEIIHQYPADHFVMIDDKPDILIDMHQILQDRVTTVLVKQGKYGQQSLPDNFSPDITVDTVSDLRNFTQQQFLQAHA